MTPDSSCGDPIEATSSREVELLESIRRIIRSYDVHSRRLLARGDVTLAQLLSLRALVELGPLTATRLAEAIHTSPSTMVGILDRLEAKNLVTRKRDAKDRRRIVVTINDNGERLVLECPPPLGEHLQQEFSRMSSREQASLAASLRLVADLIAADTAALPLSRSD